MPIFLLRRGATVALVAAVTAAVVSTIVVTVASASATASLESAEDGPLPTSITRSEDGRSTTILVHGLGDPEAERIREGRGMRHSALQPTGRFVRHGQPVTVDVPMGSPAMHVVIGLDGRYAAFNDGADRGMESTRLSPGANTVTADRDGMVFLTSTATSGSADVEVTGGQPVPVFIAGQTSNEDFLRDFERFPDAPMVTIIGERVFGDFQARTASAMTTSDLASRVHDWDRVIEVTNDHHGLLDEGVGSARKAPHRIYVASPDSGAGYASASHDRIVFQVDTGAAAELFTMRAGDLWGFWHEVGHTYQPPAYNWKGMVEVVNNVSALDVQATVFGANRLDGQQSAITRFFAQPVETRSFAAEEDVWVRLLMFDQLRRAFGQEFYPSLDQELRVRLRTGEVGLRDDAAKQQHFASIAAQIADRDLRPFFRQWGFPLDADTAASMARLPALTTPIWHNTRSADTVRERDLPTYGAPTGTAEPVTERATVGQRQLGTAPRATDLGNTDGTGATRVVGHALEADEPGVGHALVVLRNDRGIRETVSTPVDVGAGNAFRFRGLSDRTIGWLALDPLASALRFVQVTGSQAHTGFTGEEYVGFTLRDADEAQVLGEWTIRGDESGAVVAASFAQRYEEGQVLEIRHAEPRSRLTAYRDGDELPGRSDRVQRFRIVDDRIEPIVDAAVRVLPVDAVELARGADTAVPLGIVAGRELTELRADLVVVAPDGTVFAAGQSTLTGEYRNPGEGWRPASSMTLRNGKRSPDGRTISFRLDTASSFRLTQGAAARWSPQVHTPEDAVAGEFGMRWELNGTTDGGSVRLGV
ncbi:carbohydrate-binding protein (putative mucin) [Curtobacterium sp. PhB130]|uniref:M60 family metallopeptidase n=1 Tax=Curtobacterium sp. PhB130 TaxID=2485178 RepID=UPI000F4BE895|nr:M60 family metallopeptidase [Curtobacterium sp. PhB130]ROS78284.1 carbohydrate-binding protein (putative mucin) [Curtobacterium sp. PhB130]